VLCLAHRRKLITQAQGKIEQFGVPCGVEMGSISSDGEFAVVGSVQSMPSRIDRLKGKFGVLIIDEAHHAAAATYKRVIDAIAPDHVIGFTATPDRGDNKSIEEIVGPVIFEYGLRDAIVDGYLSPIVTHSLPVELDFSGIRKTAGELKQSDVEDRILPYIRGLAQSAVGAATGLKSVAFLPGIHASKMFVDELVDMGINARHVDGESKDQDEILEWFGSTPGAVLSNSDLLIEGWDEPTIESVWPMSPTLSRARYSQMVGRGTRLSDGKDHLLVLDPLWQHETHDLCTPAALLAVDREHHEEAKRLMRSSGNCDILDLVESAGASVADQRLEKLAKYIDINHKRKPKTIDPAWIASVVGDSGVFDFKVNNASDYGAAPDWMVRSLSGFRVDAEGMASGYCREAHRMVIERHKAGLASPAQLAMLQRFGVRGDMSKITKTSAGEIITKRMRGRQWKKRRAK